METHESIRITPDAAGSASSDCSRLFTRAVKVLNLLLVSAVRQQRLRWQRGVERLIFVCGSTAAAPVGSGCGSLAAHSFIILVQCVCECGLLSLCVSGNKNGVHIFQFVMHFSATFVATTIMNNSSCLSPLSLSLFVCLYTHT